MDHEIHIRYIRFLGLANDSHLILQATGDFSSTFPIELRTSREAQQLKHSGARTSAMAAKRKATVKSEDQMRSGAWGTSSGCFDRGLTFFPFHIFLDQLYPIGSMYAIYANIGGILMVNVTIYTIHGSYGYGLSMIIITHEPGTFPVSCSATNCRTSSRHRKNCPDGAKHFAMAMCACWMCNRPVAAGWWCNMVQLGYSTCVIKVQ
jgi:hypothetical protein